MNGGYCVTCPVPFQRRGRLFAALRAAGCGVRLRCQCQYLDRRVLYRSVSVLVSGKLLPIPIRNRYRQYRPIPDTGIGLSLLHRLRHGSADFTVLELS